MNWPQALLVDRGYDPVVLDYGAARPDVAFLIGPDGTLIDKGRDVADLRDAMAKALKGD
jgi:hypothetical protein